MASYTKCRICQKWGWESHKCPPRWLVAPESDTSNIYSTHAVDAEEAAEEAAERYDSDGDYYLARGNEEIFVVWREGEKSPVRVVVEGETVPSYRARELDPVAPAESGLSGCEQDEQRKEARDDLNRTQLEGAEDHE